MLTMTNLNLPHLKVEELSISRGQFCGILSRNDISEKYLLDALSGQYDQHPEILWSDNCKAQVISFESIQQVFEHELKIDETDITNEFDPGTLAIDFIGETNLDSDLIDRLSLRPHLHKGFRQLSTGQAKKLLIANAIFSGCNTLVLCHPFDGLDSSSNQALSQTLNYLHQQGTTLIMVMNNYHDIVQSFSHVAMIEAGSLTTTDDSAIEVAKRFFDVSPINVSQSPQYQARQYWHRYLCELKDCRVSFDGKVVFENINFRLKPLQHTLITGKNGAGKSTLLQLITGDCPQCYSNDVTVFGYRRGTGESIWDIKKHYGLVNSELHRYYRIACDTLTVVASGFHDSIGVYKQVNSKQISLAKQWLDFVGLRDHQQTRFQNLSFGQQRLALIARALVKSPLLLILDEPTQGLDEQHRQMVLNLITKIANEKLATILYVSHLEDEHIDIFERNFQL
ncbi:ATP-binding cassette domain-containing protein [Paraferrimonas sp. SM1919]|uniref:ATP-binding cassette domain-containing protein n=1 Tax=Paraferrimonas sp. SM1919 TaxID=2662263 RepID=UPI0013D06E4E|nr:ATP-binding cassette domain-containing protein [Paraferrimonas sp. SM1919]